MGKFIIIGAVIGGLIGWLIGFFVFSGIVLGAVVGVIFDALHNKRKNKSTEATNEVQKMQLREEHLDIKKERIKTGEVNIHKEIVEGQKTFTVPIKREEMVIEAGSDEEIRIPLKEEEIDIEITKHFVKVGELSISKQQIEEIKEVKATLKKETVRVETHGNTDVKDK
ncbi:YsnF/AvaK domain-containing protein [Bacillaceae bacterium IKA-2]|nr:YsnF/AvaK domain-containing protein [Bacillaceae bacterium IKA-2]